jgi:hypothetical protein
MKKALHTTPFKLIPDFSLFTKVLADFKSVLYLVTLLLNYSN